MRSDCVFVYIYACVCVRCRRKWLALVGSLIQLIVTDIWLISAALAWLSSPLTSLLWNWINLPRLNTLSAMEFNQLQVSLINTWFISNLERSVFKILFNLQCMFTYFHVVSLSHTHMPAQYGEHVDFFFLRQGLLVVQLGWLFFTVLRFLQKTICF